MISLCASSVPHYLKALDEDYKFVSNLTSIKGLHIKLQESQFWEFWDSHLGISRQNDIQVLAPWLDTKNTIRGRWWLPPSSSRGEFCESVFARGSSMHQKCSNYAPTNLLFGLCKFM
jgi:hypothetical protein